MKKANYERPFVDTVPASRILELLGPVSCGSGGNHEQAITGTISFPMQGNQKLSS